MNRFSVALDNAARFLKIRQPLLRQFVAEMIGTFVLVSIGLGGNIQAEVLKSMGKRSLMSLEVVWSIALLMAILVSIRGGYGLVNPAFSFSWFILRKISIIQMLIFCLAQLIGAFLGAVVSAAVYTDALHELGPLTMNGTAVYFVTTPLVANGAAFADQLMGTGLLVGLSVAMVDPHNLNIPFYLLPFLLCIVLIGVLSTYGINAGAPLNPARDLGPRIYVAIRGAGWEAFSANNYFFWVPIVGPLMGAALGCFVYELGIGLHLPGRMETSDKKEANEDQEEDETQMLE